MTVFENNCVYIFQLVLVLPWKYFIFIEYHIRAAWPPTQSVVNTEVWIEGKWMEASGHEENGKKFYAIFRFHSSNRHTQKQPLQMSCWNCLKFFSTSVVDNIVCMQYKKVIVHHTFYKFHLI